MSLCAKNRRLCAAIMLLEDEEEDHKDQIMKLREERSPLYRMRSSEAYFQLLINNHLKCSDVKFREFFRLNKAQFDFVASLIESDLIKPCTNTIKDPISPKEKLAVTLRFLVTGETCRSLSFAFRISGSYISIIVENTLNALCRRLMPLFLKAPSKDELKEKANEFWRKWNFPNCVAGIDGKHIRIFCPKRSGSLFFNYKGYFSIVLLAMIDANYKFIYADVGSYGKEGYSGILKKSKIGREIYSGNLFPLDSHLPGSESLLPYVVIGDEAFQTHRHILKPFTKPVARADRKKAIFNYRLCRARRVTENGFGLLCQVFRIYYTHIAIKPEICEELVLATLCLHNLLRDAYLEQGGCPYYKHKQSENMSQNVLRLSQGGGFANGEGLQVRQQFADFFNEEGAVEWQDNAVDGH